MFAGAAREAVFSNPDVIRRVNAEFVPVALKAALVNSPPGGDEGRLYREIGRSKPAPQGICVANSAGKVLDWALMFDDDASVLEFFDHSLKQFRAHPDAKQPVAAERYMRFPSAKLPDVSDSREVLPIADRHPSGQACPAKPGLRKGTVVARVFGRALDADGKLIPDTVRQEHYVEDRFEVSLEAQELVAKKLAEAGTARFKLPDELTRLVVAHAFLGQLDVNPLGSPAGGGGELTRCEFRAQRASEDRAATTRLRIEGESEVAGGQDASRPDGRSDGRIWQHDVQLKWEGLIEVEGRRITRLLLLARGSEKLKWGNALITGASDVTRLPGGHPIDLASGVRYGIIGEPAGADEVGAEASEQPRADASQPPPELTQHLRAALGPSFAVFLPVVQDDLNLSDEQTQILQQLKTSAARGFGQFVQQAEGLPPGEREKKHHEFRQEANKSLHAALAQLLKPDQQNRLRQIVLQQEGLFALGNPNVAAELKFGNEQERRFLQRIMQETQKRIEGLHQKAQTTGNPAEIQQDAVRIRKEQAAKIEALLTESQREQWKAMLGKPLDLGL